MTETAGKERTGKMEHRLREEVSERLKHFKRWEAVMMVVLVGAMLIGLIYYAAADRIQAERMLREVRRRVAQDTGTVRIGAPEGFIPILMERVPECEVTEIDGPYIAGNARRAGCDYFLSEHSVDLEELEDTGYELAARKGDYYLYISLMAAGEWKITQYGTVSGLQSMCYSLVSRDGTFILLDGGHDVDAAGLRRLIGEFGNHVDLWICSHFHEDHIGAVTAMLSDLGETEIGELWCPPMDIDTYRTFAKEWDSVETCEAFLQEIAGLDNVSRVQNGEMRSFGGLDLTFFSSYTENAPWTHEGNNCGFIFQVKGKEETMLFCCDVGNDWISEVLVNAVGERLKSDYVQMGHHGNGGLSEAAYRLVAPRAAFFDGPSWLFADTEKYTAAKNRTLMESMGCEIYLMDDAPNSIILR